MLEEIQDQNDEKAMLIVLDGIDYAWAKFRKQFMVWLHDISMHYSLTMMITCRDSIAKLLYESGISYSEITLSPLNDYESADLLIENTARQITFDELWLPSDYKRTLHEALGFEDKLSRCLGNPRYIRKLADLLSEHDWDEVDVLTEIPDLPTLDIRDLANLPSIYDPDSNNPYYNTHYNQTSEGEETDPSVRTKSIVTSKSFQTSDLNDLQNNLRKQLSFDQKGNVYHYPDLDMKKHKVNSIPHQKYKASSFKFGSSKEETKQSRYSSSNLEIPEVEDPSLEVSAGSKNTPNKKHKEILVCIDTGVSEYADRANSMGIMGSFSDQHPDSLRKLYNAPKFKSHESVALVNKFDEMILEPQHPQKDVNDHIEIPVIYPEDVKAAVDYTDEFEFENENEQVDDSYYIREQRIDSIDYQDEMYPEESLVMQSKAKGSKGQGSKGSKGSKGKSNKSNKKKGNKAKDKEMKKERKSNFK